MEGDAGLTPAAAIAAHRATGEQFRAAGVQSFVRAEGPLDGDPIVCTHGLPSSSYLYRKVLPELAAAGFRAISFDLPGLGLAERPPAFDSTFTGPGRWALAAVDALGLERFHLVVHDAGGPVGFELAHAAPERIRSLTLLNTVVDVETVPFPMEWYAKVATGPRWPALPPAAITRELLYRIGVDNTPTADRSGVPCFFDDDPTAAWTTLSGDEYVASGQNIGAGAPQGVNCEVDEVLASECLDRLKAYIADTGGTYEVAG